MIRQLLKQNTPNLLISLFTGLLIVGAMLWVNSCKSAETNITSIDLSLEKLSDDAREPLACAQLFTCKGCDASKAVICKPLFDSRAKQKDEARLNQRFVFCRKIFYELRNKKPTDSLTAAESILKEQDFNACWQTLNPATK